MFYFCLNVGEHNLDEVTVVSLIMFQNARGLVYTYCHRYKTNVAMCMPLILLIPQILFFCFCFMCCDYFLHSMDIIVA